jgi:hypothetical protein
MGPLRFQMNLVSLRLERLLSGFHFPTLASPVEQSSSLKNYSRPSTVVVQITHRASASHRTVCRSSLLCSPFPTHVVCTDSRLRCSMLGVRSCDLLADRGRRPFMRESLAIRCTGLIWLLCCDTRMSMRRARRQDTCKLDELTPHREAHEVERLEEKAASTVSSGVASFAGLEYTER